MKSGKGLEGISRACSYLWKDCFVIKKIGLESEFVIRN
jgi:hypothetical protein